MTNARPATAMATAALLLAAVAACAGDGSDPPDPEGPVTSSSSTPSATTATEDPETASEAAGREATAVMLNYYAVRDELRTDPSTRITKLKDVAISGELAAQRALYKRERAEGLRQTGDTEVAEVDLQSVNLDNSAPDAGRVPTVQIDVCYDVTEVDILDKNGRSIVDNDRPDTGWIRYLVSNFNYEADPSDSWRVASSQNLERRPCNPV